MPTNTVKAVERSCEISLADFDRDMDKVREITDTEYDRVYFGPMLGLGAVPCDCGCQDGDA